MTCDRCHKGFEGRSYEMGGLVVCGICSITLTGRAPGIIGQDYPKQVNPEKYDAAKEQSIAIEWMEKQPAGSPNHIDYRTAARWKKVFVEHSERVAAAVKSTPESWRKSQQEMSQTMEKVQHDEIAGRVKKSELALKKIDEQWRMHAKKD